MSRKTLGDHIKAKRYELGLSQQELAAKLGFATWRIGRWERDVLTPTEAEWSALAALLALRSGLNPINSTATSMLGICNRAEHEPNAQVNA